MFEKLFGADFESFSSTPKKSSIFENADYLKFRFNLMNHFISEINN